MVCVICYTTDVIIIKVLLQTCRVRVQPTALAYVAQALPVLFWAVEAVRVPRAFGAVRGTIRDSDTLAPFVGHKALFATCCVVD